MEQVNDQVGGVALVHWNGRWRKIVAVQSSYTVNVFAGAQLAHEGTVSSGGEKSLSNSRNRHDVSRVTRDFFEGLISCDGRYGQQINGGIGVCEKKREGVVVAGIAIENHFFHGLCVH